MEYSLATGNVVSQLVVTGSGFQLFALDDPIILDATLSTLSTRPTVTFTVDSDTQLTLNFTSFPFTFVGQIGLQLDYFPTSSIFSRSQSAKTEFVATVFVAAPVLVAQPLLSVLSSSSTMVLQGSGFADGACDAHEVVFTAECGTVTATPTGVCSTTLLTVEFTELSSTTPGNLTAQVGR